MIPNVVLQRDTALSTDMSKPSPVLDVVRSLLNSSLEVDVSSKQEILCKFALKILNNKHSLESCRFILTVHPITVRWLGGQSCRKVTESLSLYIFPRSTGSMNAN